MLARRPKYEVVKNQRDKENDLPEIKRAIITPGCLRSSISTVILILVYFVPSIGLTFYQRWLFQKLHFPLMVVLVHLIVKYVLAVLIRTAVSCQQGKSRTATLGWKEYIIIVAPAGVFSGFDIGFSNWGLALVTISLYTMTKSTTIVFILGFAILLKLEKKSWSLSVIVVMISIGLFLFTYEATQFNMLGFLLVLFASMSSGLRWTCAQLLLQKSKMGMKNPIDMIYHMQPWMMISVLPFAMFMEGPAFVRNCQTFQASELTMVLHTVSEALVGAFIAFFMEVSEVMVVTYTSSLTLSIAGIFKELLILVLAVVWNGDKMSPINIVGLLVCLSGIICHVIHKIQTVSHHSSSHFYDNEKYELGESLIDDKAEQLSLSSDSEGELSDTQVLFNILNRHDR